MQFKLWLTDHSKVIWATKGIKKYGDKKQFAAAHHNETEEIALSHHSISDAQQHKVCLFVVWASQNRPRISALRIAFWGSLLLSRPSSLPHCALPGLGFREAFQPCVSPLSELLSAVSKRSPQKPICRQLEPHTQHRCKCRVTLTSTDAYIDNCIHTHTFHTFLWAKQAEWQNRGWDKWYNDIQAWLVSGAEREGEEGGEKKRGGWWQLWIPELFFIVSQCRRTLGSNSGLVMCKERGSLEKRGALEERWWKSWRAAVMTTLCFHTRHLLISLSKARFLFLLLPLPPDILFSPLSSSLCCFGLLLCRHSINFLPPWLFFLYLFVLSKGTTWPSGFPAKWLTNIWVSQVVCMCVHWFLLHCWYISKNKHQFLGISNPYQYQRLVLIRQNITSGSE